MDWKGYGIVQQCGTCEPLQSRTSSSRMTSDTMDIEKAEFMLRGMDVIQIAHQCTMQEREKQPASDAGKKKKEIVTTCSRD